jgi:aspartyl/asparaginyl beta-hydroxylase (cupin superfamily)
MAELDSADRKKIDKRQFAYVDKDGTGRLPIHDESHIRNAMARWNQTDFPSQTAKDAARRKILAAARRHKIDVSEEDKVAKSRAT